MDETEIDTNPWHDPAVKARLDEGISPSEITLIDCPSCGGPGYYNNGSHFACRLCNANYDCITEEEEPPEDGRYLYLGDEYSLDDWDAFEQEGP